MEFFDNKLCISFRELVDGGIMTVPNYKYMASSGRIKVARRGVCNENSEYHDRIIALVNKNANLIRQRMKAA